MASGSGRQGIQKASSRGARESPEFINKDETDMRRTISVIAAVAALALWAGSVSADGDGAYSSGTVLDANLGSGKQINAEDWKEMMDVNVDGNQLTGGAINSNGGDRLSDDVVLNLGEYPLVASAALDVTVSGNEISVSGDGSSASSSLTFSGGSGFMDSYGVTAVAINSGANASQSVNVNVMSDVSL